MIKNNILRYFVISVLLASPLAMAQNPAFAAVAPDLGDASDFGVLAGKAVTNDVTLGVDTLITGDLGATSTTGLSAGQVTGDIFIKGTDQEYTDGQADASTAFGDLDQTCTNNGAWPGGANPTSVQLAGLTLEPGVYCSGDTMNLADGGTLILDGAGVYIFKAATGLTTVSDSNVLLTGGATADNVFWRVGSTATLAAPTGAADSPTVFPGTIIAQTDITQTGGTTGTILEITGRLITLDGLVSFASSTTVSVPTPGGSEDNSSNEALLKKLGLLDHGRDKEWKTKPTYGVLYQTNTQFVTDGFGYSTFAKTITDNFHTDFSMTDIPTDTSYPLYAKGYFANALKIQEFCFGIPEVGKGYLAESCVEVHFDYGFEGAKKITNVKVVQDSGVIDDVSVQHQMAKCSSASTVKLCDKTMITIAFAEPLQHSVMMIKGIDWKNKFTETYLNEGFNVNGKQLTDLPTTMIPSPTKYEGLIKVTQSEKYSNIWISDDERVFERNSFGSFSQTNQQTSERPQDTGDVKNRTHSAFDDLKDQQAIKAKNIWDASKHVSTLEPSFAYDYPVEDDRTKFLAEHNMLEFVRGQ